MANGLHLQRDGYQVLSKMGLTCIQPPPGMQVPLRRIDPSGPYSTGDNLEIDYLIPFHNTCLVGEITGRSDPRAVQRKYRRFRNHYNVLRMQDFTNDLWTTLGVPQAEISYFRDVQELRAFFITTTLQRFDVDLQDVPNLARFYKADWELVKAYAESIGNYAQFPFLDLFDIPALQPRETFTPPASYVDRKTITTGDVAQASVYTFVASPYELLPISAVFRRDTLPDLSSQASAKYQRPLNPEKLKQMRHNLLHDQNRDFMFPNNILTVLSSDCSYDADKRILQIPKNYGAITVIDGQHRLFSYADNEVKSHVRDGSRIMVTAIQFTNTDHRAQSRSSARAFIEINMNQTRISPTHFDAIAYDILGETSSRAIAAKILLQANEGTSRLRGLFDTNRTGLGKIQTTTVLTALRPITDLNRIARLSNVRPGSRSHVRRQGYENLFGSNTADLIIPHELITHGTFFLERYFSHVAKTFSRDWPQRGKPIKSALGYAKFMAAFVRLAREFVREGLDWEGVKSELESLRDNIQRLRKMRVYRAPLLSPHPSVPDAAPSVNDDYRFLAANRQRPTSVQRIRRR